MNLLITAISSATGPSGICRHAYNLVRCAASRKEVLHITLAIGKWQKLYFQNSFKLEDAKLTIVAVFPMTLLLEIFGIYKSCRLWQTVLLPI
jgi:hypothetical protein